MFILPLKILKFTRMQFMQQAHWKVDMGIYEHMLHRAFSKKGIYGFVRRFLELFGPQDIVSIKTLKFVTGGRTELRQEDWMMLLEFIPPNLDLVFGSKRNTWESMQILL